MDAGTRQAAGWKMGATTSILVLGSGVIPKLGKLMGDRITAKVIEQVGSPKDDRQLYGQG